MFPVLAKKGLGLLAFSPMDAGALSPENPPEGALFAALCGVLDEVAARLNTNRGALCAAWVLAHDEVTSVLSGAESPAHVDEMLAGARLELPPEPSDPSIREHSSAPTEAHRVLSGLDLKDEAVRDERLRADPHGRRYALGDLGTSRRSATLPYASLGVHGPRRHRVDPFVDERRRVRVRP